MVFTKVVSRSTRISYGYVARCSQSTVAETSRASRPVTYEEAKEKIKMGRRFGLEGLSSGVDTRQLWPSVEEIQEISEIRLHRAAREAREIAEKAEREKVERQVERVEEIDKKLNNAQ